MTHSYCVTAHHKDSNGEHHVNVIITELDEGAADELDDLIGRVNEGHYPTEIIADDRYGEDTRFVIVQYEDGTFFQITITW